MQSPKSSTSPSPLSLAKWSIAVFTTSPRLIIGGGTDPVVYLACNADWLGVLKRKRKRNTSLRYLLNLTNPESP